MKRAIARTRYSCLTVNWVKRDNGSKNRIATIFLAYWTVLDPTACQPELSASPLLRAAA